MPKAAAAKAAGGGKKKKGTTMKNAAPPNDLIDLDTPPKKKPCASNARFSTERRGGYTVNHYAHGTKNKIHVVLHEGGVSRKDKKPQVSLLLGGKTLSVQWKTSERLFYELQASTQGIERDSSRFMGYSDTMQAMAKSGVAAVDGYHRETPQIIHLDVEHMGNPKVKVFLVPTMETVVFHGKNTCNSIPCMFVP